VGEKFRQRAFKFPGLTSGCTLDWFQPWPREALVAVARHFLADFTLLNQTDLLHEVENALGSIQESVAETAKEYFQRFRRSTHVTPRTYLSFLSSYKTVFANKTMEIGGMSTRIETGLAKLQEASETVEKLKMDLAEMEKELALASETAETVCPFITYLL
jgi:dynein heavy chain